MSTEGGEESASSIYHTRKLWPDCASRASDVSTYYAGYLPVPYTLHLSAWSTKGEKVCLTKGAGPTQAWTVHTTSFEPPKAAPAFLGCCHLPHPVTCHIHFSRQGVKVALTQCLAIAPSLSAPFCSIHVLFKFRKRSSDGRLSLKCNSQMSTCKHG